MLTCKEVCENAQDFADRNSSVLMRVRIRLHLAMCRNCTNFVDQTRKTKQLISQSLASDTNVKVSPDLMAAFQQKANETHVEKSAPVGDRERRQSDDT